MSHVVTIHGSPQAGSRSAAVANHLAELVHAAGFETAAITVRDLPAAELVAGRGDSGLLAAAVERVTRARALIVATPVYKASFTGLLKLFLDALAPDALAGKIILPLATGASLAHFLSIDYAMRPVLAALGAEHVLRGVYLVDAQIIKDAGGRFSFADDAAAELRRAAEAVVASLKESRT